MLREESMVLIDELVMIDTCRLVMFDFWLMNEIRMDNILVWTNGWKDKNFGFASWLESILIEYCSHSDWCRWSVKKNWILILVSMVWFRTFGVQDLYQVRIFIGFTYKILVRILESNLHLCNCNLQGWYRIHIWSRLHIKEKCSHLVFCFGIKMRIYLIMIRILVIETCEGMRSV